MGFRKQLKLKGPGIILEIANIINNEKKKNK